MKSLEEFQKFIEQHEIKSKTEFSKKYSNIYKKARELKLLKLLKFEKGNKSWGIDLSQLSTVEGCQKFINDHSNEINTAIDLVNKYPTVYKRIQENGFASKVTYPKGRLKNSLSDYNTLEDFQNLANNYSSPMEFTKNHKTISDRFFKLKKKEIISGELYFPNRKNFYGDTYTKVEEFQKFINENGIKSPTDFESNFGNLYKRLTSLGFSKLVYYENRKTEAIDNYSNFNSLEQIQDFIIKHKIFSRLEFENRANSLYRKYLVLREKENRDIIFMDSSTLSSNEEWKAVKELIKFNIDFKLRYKIKGYRYIYDIYLPKFNIIIEVNGSQHFSHELKPSYWLDRDEEKNDIIKYQIAKDAGIEVYYVAYDTCWKAYEVYGYFCKVYKSIEIILTEVLNLNIVENNNFEKDLENFICSDFLTFANRIIKEFKIYNECELSEHKFMYQRIKEFGCLDKITYYKGEDE